MATSEYVEAEERIEKFIAEYEKISGQDPDIVYGLNRGSAHQAEVRISDLKALLAAPLFARCTYCGTTFDIRT